MANLTDADKVIRNDVGKTIASKLDDIADAIVAQGGGAHSLGQLSDVDIDTQTLVAGQIIEYDDNDGKWKNVANPASTTNFGADYDENTTYNTGDKCVYNNLLYECNDDGVTGAWDATKWDSLTVASMTDNNLPHYTGTPTAGSTAEAIGDLSQLTTTDKSSLVGAVNEVDGELSNKADKALTAFNLTAGTGMTLQYVNCFAFGNLKVISANIVVGSDATTTIATVPSGYSALNSTFFYLGKNGASGAYGYITGTSLRTDSVLSAGNYTINFVYR